MNLIAILQFIQIVANILIGLPKLILALEGMFPEGGQGAKKLALAREAIQASLPRDAPADTLDRAWPTIDKAIAARVAADKAIAVDGKDAT